MAIGIEVQSDKLSSCNVITGIKGGKIIQTIKRIIATYGLDDKKWAEAITSQYFLICLAQDLQLKYNDYEKLIDKCLIPFRVTQNNEFVLERDRVLFAPEEAKESYLCMLAEDDADLYYRSSGKMEAKNIDWQKMYWSYHYGLLVRIASAEDKAALNKVKTMCLDILTEKDAIDEYGGWYPYRIPWITARILICLRSIDFSSYNNRDCLKAIIEDAINSLFSRIYEKESYWRSGVGTQITKWESTALCLEALFVWEAIDNHKTEVEKILRYVIEKRNEWLSYNVDFSTKESSNIILSAVTLASVIFRIIISHFNENSDFMSVLPDIVVLFDNVVTRIVNQDVINGKQYCTLPQLLYYIVAALN